MNNQIKPGEFDQVVAKIADYNDAERPYDVGRRDPRRSKAGKYIARTAAVAFVTGVTIAGANALVEQTDISSRQGEAASQALANRPHDPIAGVNPDQAVNASPVQSGHIEAIPNKQP